jgi:hypothetical protein
LADPSAAKLELDRVGSAVDGDALLALAENLVLSPAAPLAFLGEIRVRRDAVDDFDFASAALAFPRKVDAGEAAGMGVSSGFLGVLVVAAHGWSSKS